MSRHMRNLFLRQLWNSFDEPLPTTQAHCPPFTLPSNGVIQLADSSAITLTTNVLFQPQCTGISVESAFPIDSLQQPFYASITPVVYVIAAATVLAWILVIMLTITPRTSFFGLPTAAPAFNNGHGIIGGANGGLSGLSGAGSRPWLQKAAALLVAISLTIATADTLEVAQSQYDSGTMNAEILRQQVLGSLEIRITRVISDIFLWLAQVQTLIRLFPRHKEKVLIKWIGFFLIILDTTFSCLNSFLINSTARGRQFEDAIPALSYLFQLALGLLYAAWVLYYAMTKRRYAFYNPKMRSISLIALLSAISILTPVVFFVIDVVNQDVAGWGDYFRWVGAAAASVVVWEWVERIEALERDDKKDGILGREIFDGDEMLDVVAGSDDTQWSQSRNLRRNFQRQGLEDNDAVKGANIFGGAAQRLRRYQQSTQHFPLGRMHSHPVSSNSAGQNEDRTGHIVFGDQPRPGLAMRTVPVAPQPVASPVNRANTTSAASTVYVVRYHQAADAPQPIRRKPPSNQQERRALERPRRQDTGNAQVAVKDILEDQDEPHPNRHGESGRWNAVANPFKRKRTSPPQEVQRAQAAESHDQRAVLPAHNFPKWDIKNRLGVFAAEAGEKLRDRAAGRRQQVDLPVTVIPAQPRGNGRTWSPHDMDASESSAAVASEHMDRHRSSRGLPSGAVIQPEVIYSGALRPGAEESSSTPKRRDWTPPTNPTAYSRTEDNTFLMGGRDRAVVVPAPARRTPARTSTSTPSTNQRSSLASALTEPSAISNRSSSVNG